MATLERKSEWLAFMPSGIKPGSELTPSMREALERHAGRLPLAYQPVIEEGNYEDFKACVFRVCSDRAVEVIMKDLEQECYDKGIATRAAQRTWNYSPDTGMRCVTCVHLVMTIPRPEKVDVREYLAYLADKYGYTYNRMTVNTSRGDRPLRIRMDGLMAVMDDGMYREPTVSVEAELVWPQWM